MASFGYCDPAHHGTAYLLASVRTSPAITASSDGDGLASAAGSWTHWKKINISTVLAGQNLGIKEVDEGIWLVSFMHYALGYIDLEQRTLQTIDNPFGTRLSPMS